MDSKRFMIVSSIISFVLVICLVSSIFILNVKTSDDKITISFEDELVCQKVASDLENECINKSIRLTKESIDSYETFTINDNITSLLGLENFPNLQTLQIYNALDLNNFDILKDLNIGTLAINSISDVTVLNNLTSLKVLDLSNASINDVTGLNLPNLTKLIISNTNITDVAHLNNGKLRITKDGLLFHMDTRQELDEIMMNLNLSYRDFKTDGFCLVDSKYRLIYDEETQTTTCTITTPDRFLTLTYDLVLN